jgi:hypothetical protein
MSRPTPALRLPYFERGDTYSATLDRARMIMVDEQLRAFGDAVGDGVVDGLDIDILGQSIRLSPGSAFVNGTFCQMLLAADLPIPQDGEGVFLQRQPNSFVKLGKFSSSRKALVSEPLAVMPPYFSANVVDGMVELYIDWSSASIATKYVNIMTDGIFFASVDRTQGGFSMSIEEGSSFFISLVPYSYIGEEGTHSSQLLVTRFYADREPPPPTGVGVVENFESASVVFDRAPTGLVRDRVVRWRRVDGFGNEFGDENEAIVNPYATHVVILNLENNVRYRLSVFHRSLYGSSSFEVKKYFSPSQSAAPGDVDDISAEVLRSDTGRFFLRIKPLINSPYADLDSTYVRIHKNGSFGFEYSSNDILLPRSGVLDVYSLNVTQGSSSYTRLIEDNSVYTVVVYRRVGGRDTRGRFSRVYTGDSTPPPPVYGISGVADSRGGLRFTWGHDQPNEVLKYEVGISARRILSRTLILDEPLQDAVYIGTRFTGMFCDISLTVQGRSLRITALSNDYFDTIEGFDVVHMDLSGKSIRDVVSFINSASLRFRSRTGGIVYLFSQLVEARAAFTLSDTVSLSADGVRLFPVDGAAELLASVSGSRLSPISPIKIRAGIIDGPFEDNTGGFFSAGGMVLQAISPSENHASLNYAYELGDIESSTSVKTRISSYSIPGALVKPGFRYEVAIRAVDHSNNASELSTYDFNSPFPDDMADPGLLDSVFSSPVDEGMLVVWDEYMDLPASRFNIYRASISASGTVGPYAQIASVDSLSNHYVDIMVTDGFSYLYKVGYENIWGKRSIPPSNTDSTSKIGVVSQFVSRSQLPGPTGLRAEMVGDDLICSWSAYQYACDGLQVWVSDPVSGHFRLAGDVSRDSASFTYKNARTAKGEYRFAIRAIVSECTAVVASLDNPPGNSLLLYTGNAPSNLTDARIDLRNLHDPVVASTKNLLLQHRHFRYSDGSDFRIDLGDNYVVSDYSTEDGVIFTPLSAIEPGINASTGVVLINGGPPAVSYVVSSDGSIEFATAVDVNSQIRLVVFGTTEVDGILNQSRIGDVSAQQFSSGKLSLGVLPDINHDEQFVNMIPATCLAETADGYKWFATVNERRKVRYYHTEPSLGWSEVSVDIADAQAEAPLGSMPTGFPICRGGGRSFIYDIWSDGSRAFLATSLGSYFVSNIFNLQIGVSRELRASAPPDDCGVIHRVRILAPNVVAFVGFRGIDIMIDQGDGTDMLYPLASSIGLSDGVRCFRDIIAISENVFLAISSSALWRISIQPNGVVARSQVRPVSSGGSVIWCAFKLGEQVFVYTDDGMFVGDNSLSFFDPVEFMPPRLRVLDIVNADLEHVILIATHSVWVFRDSGAIRVYESKARLGRACVHDGKLFVCTEDGLLRTDAATDIFSSESFKFNKVHMPNFSDGRFFLPLTVRSDGIRIYVGGEGAVLSATNINRWGKLVDTYLTPLSGGESFSSDLVKESPTLYVDGKPRHLGVYFQFSESASYFEPISADTVESSVVESGQAECIFFDDPPSSDQDVRVARSYLAWLHPRGSWAHIDYCAPVAVKINGRIINDGSRAARPYDDVAYLASMTPQFGEEASNQRYFMSAFSDMVAHADFMLVNAANPSNGQPEEYGVHKFSRANMRALMRKIERANRYVYDTFALARMGVDSEYKLPHPTIRVDLLANAFVAPYGVRRSSLDLMGILWTEYFGDEVRGGIGVWDAEDIGYRLPPVISREVNAGALAPNYAPLAADEDALSVPIEDLSFSGEFTYFGAIPGVMRFFGRRRPNGTVLVGPPDVLLEKLDQF